MKTNIFIILFAFISIGIIDGNTYNLEQEAFGVTQEMLQEQAQKLEAEQNKLYLLIK